MGMGHTLTRCLDSLGATMPAQDRISALNNGALESPYLPLLRAPVSGHAHGWMWIYGRARAMGGTGTAYFLHIVTVTVSFF
jgi:hypothetical protein